jgi:hypothetical protein
VKDTEIEPTNNFAERQIKHHVKYRKNSLFTWSDLCDATENLEESGLAESIAIRLNYLRRYSKRFLSLDFEAAKGSKSLLKGIEILRQYQTCTIKELPDNVPVRFLPKICNMLCKAALKLTGTNPMLLAFRHSSIRMEQWKKC